LSAAFVLAGLGSLGPACLRLAGADNAWCVDPAEDNTPMHMRFLHG
jgi:hypothetical protein